MSMHKLDGVLHRLRRSRLIHDDDRPGNLINEQTHMLTYRRWSASTSRTCCWRTRISEHTCPTATSICQLYYWLVHLLCVETMQSRAVSEMCNNYENSNQILDQRHIDTATRCNIPESIFKLQLPVLSYLGASLETLKEPREGDLITHPMSYVHDRCRISCVIEVANSWLFFMFTTDSSTNFHTIPFLVNSSDSHTMP